MRQWHKYKDNLSYYSPCQCVSEIHTSGLGVIASKLWNSGSSKSGDFRTIYAPLFLYLSSVACMADKNNLSVQITNNEKMMFNFSLLRIKIYLTTITRHLLISFVDTFLFNHSTNVRTVKSLFELLKSASTTCYPHPRTVKHELICNQTLTNLDIFHQLLQPCPAVILFIYLLA